MIVECDQIRFDKRGIEIYRLLEDQAALGRYREYFNWGE